MSTINIPSQTILDYSLSAMCLNTPNPGLYGTITPPENTTATLEISFFLFEKADSPLPYAYASVGGVAVAPGLLTKFAADNGAGHGFPDKVPQKIEIQIVTSAEVRAKKNTIVIASH